MLKMISQQVIALLFWLGGKAIAAPDPAPGGALGRRAVVTSRVTSWSTSTSTVNPSDPTVWATYGTVTVWAFTTTSTRSSACVSLSDIYPPEDPTPTDSATTTVTATVTFGTTVTETHTDAPLTTRYSFTFVVVSLPTGRTEELLKCTNTAVRSFYVTATKTSTHTIASAYSMVRATEVCKIWSTRWLPDPSVTFVTSSSTTTPWWDPKYYTSGTTIITVSEPFSRSTWVTVRTELSLETSIICDNPSVVTTSTYYTLTKTPTSYVQRTDCPRSSATPTPTHPPYRRGGVAAVADKVNGLREETARSQTPVETRTVRSTTSGLLNNGTFVTVTQTGIAEGYVRTFTTVVMVGATVTASTTTTVSLCSVPTWAAT